jgi:hypothetical protein
MRSVGFHNNRATCSKSCGCVTTGDRKRQWEITGAEYRDRTYGNLAQTQIWSWWNPRWKRRVYRGGNPAAISHHVGK